MTAVDREAEDARALLQDIVGEAVYVVDDNSQPSMPDLGWMGEGYRHICEVTQMTSQTEEERIRAWDRHSRASGPEKALARLWLVVLDESARYAGARSDLLDILAELEKTGPFDFRSGDQFKPGSPAAVRKALARGVTQATSFIPVEAPPGLDIVHLQGGSSSGAEEIPRALDRLLVEKPDNVAKLAAWPADFRHLFVWVRRYDTGPAWAMSYGLLPSGRPTLPSSLDHIWLADGPSYAWHFSRSGGWVEAVRPGYQRPPRRHETGQSPFGS